MIDDEPNHNHFFLSQESKLLQSDSFSLIVECSLFFDQSIVITPRIHEPFKSSFRSYGDLPTHLLDEVVFLQGLVGNFFHDIDGYDTLYIEHNLTDSANTYPRMYCFPNQGFLSNLKQKLNFQLLSTSLFGLSEAAKKRPYVFIQTFSGEQNENLYEAWVGLVNNGDKEYLFSILESNKEERYSKHDLKTQFEMWIRSIPKYKIKTEEDVITLDYIASIEQSNKIGYNQLAQAYQGTWVQEIYQEAVDRFIKCLPKRNDPLEILDVGCGPGQYLKVFWEHGFQCVGIDSSPQMVENARNLFANSNTAPQVNNISLFDLQLAPNSFDGIWFSAVIVHAPRRSLPAIFTRLREILRDNGLLYVSARLGHGSTVRREGRIFFYFTLGELETYFRDAGFKIIDCWTDVMDRGTTGKTEKSWGYFLLGKNDQMIDSIGGPNW
ncbi:MAG: class I SAM-dependent methyltransferase [Chloroflexi bacterium]|nr:class I SAM-dependent methyltransferase [Chloroflexota bacterium]